MKVITSFPPSLYGVYGEKFLRTFREHSNLELDVYIEGGQGPCPTLPDVNYIDLDEVKELTWFLKVISQIPIFDEPDWINDMRRFCKKGFAIIHALDQAKGKVFWIDADVEFYGPLDRNFIKNMVRSHTVAWMPRGEYHACTSFIGFNTSGKAFKALLMALKQTYWMWMFLYCSAWNDASVLTDLLDSGQFDDNKLTDPNKFRGPHNVFDDVFDGVARHLKGNKKGISPRQASKAGRR